MQSTWAVSFALESSLICRPPLQRIHLGWTFRKRPCSTRMSSERDCLPRATATQLTLRITRTGKQNSPLQGNNNSALTFAATSTSPLVEKSARTQNRKGASPRALDAEALQTRSAAQLAIAKPRDLALPTLESPKGIETFCAIVREPISMLLPFRIGWKVPSDRGRLQRNKHF